MCCRAWFEPCALRKPAPASASNRLPTCPCGDLRASGKLIGDLFADPEDDTFSVGWNFNPAFFGKGHAHEAASALFAHLFTARAARWLYAYVEHTNVASQRLRERLGMRKEGVFKAFISFRKDANGTPIDENTMRYALLY